MGQSYVRAGPRFARCRARPLRLFLVYLCPSLYACLLVPAIKITFLIYSAYYLYISLQGEPSYFIKTLTLSSLTVSP